MSQMFWPVRVCCCKDFLLTQTKLRTLPCSSPMWYVMEGRRSGGLTGIRDVGVGRGSSRVVGEGSRQVWTCTAQLALLPGQGAGCWLGASFAGQLQSAAVGIVTSMVNKSLIRNVSAKFRGYTCCGLSAAIVTAKFCYDSIKPALVCH